MNTIKAPLLRHKPGLRAKQIKRTSHFQTTATAAGDPLMANYTLVKLNSVITTYKSPGNGGEQLTIQPFSMDYKTEPDSFLKPEKSGIIAPVKTNAGNCKNETVVTGDFDGNGKDEIAIIYTDEQQQLIVDFYSFDEASGYLKLSSFGAGDCEKGSVRALRLVNGEKDQLFMAWATKINGRFGLRYVCLGTDSITNMQPFPKAATGFDLGDHPLFELACGTFTGAQNNELVFTYYAAGINLKLCRLDADHILDIISSTTIKKTKQGAIPPILEMVAGAFLPGTASDGIVICSTDSVGKPVLYTCRYEAAAAVPFLIHETLLAEDTDLLRMSAGDINNDGVEELVVALRNDSRVSGHVKLNVYRFSNTLVPQLTSSARVYGTENCSFAAIDFKIGISQLKYQATPDEDPGPVASGAILLVGLGCESIFMATNGYLKMSLGVLQVNPQCELPPYLVKDVPVAIQGCFSEELVYTSSDIWTEKIGLAMGDFTGATIRVGAPRMRVEHSVNSVVAVIKAPPVLEGSEILGSISFNSSQGAHGTLNLSTHNTVTYSDQLSETLGTGLLGSVTHSLTNTYGEDFTHSNDKTASVSVSLQVSSDGADFVVFSKTVFNVWEYPVYYKDHKQKGSILIIFPQSKPVISIEPAKNIASFFRSNSINGNILSYLPAFNGDNFCDKSFDVGGKLDISVDLHISDGKGEAENYTASQTTQIHNSQSLNLNIPIDFINGLNIGVSHTSDQTYANSKTSNQSIGINRSTTIHISYNNTALPVNQYYTVQPLIYFNREFGYLVVDYITSVPVSSTWYQKGTGNEVAPIFYKLWAGKKKEEEEDEAAAGHEQEHRTRDIDFVRNEQNGELTDVYVTVHNTTLNECEAVAIQLYRNLPAKGNEIGTARTTGRIAPRTGSTLIFDGLPLKDWINADTAAVAVYAVIDPEMHLPAKTGDIAKPSCKIGFGTYPPGELNRVRF